MTPFVAEGEGWQPLCSLVLAGLHSQLDGSFVLAGICIVAQIEPDFLADALHRVVFGQDVTDDPLQLFVAADPDGNVALEMTVPSDIELGNHTVRICWAGTCHQQTPLRVVSGVGEVPSSTPVANSTPGTSPTATRSPGSTPLPGSTATPRSTPTSGTTAYPTSTPTSTPKTSPKPSPSPSSSSNPTPTPYVTLVSVSASLTTKVTFHYFYGTATAIYLCQDGTCYPYALNPLSVTPGTSWTVSFKTPVGIKPTSSFLHVGQARVTTGCCGYSNYVSVVA